MSEKSAAFGTLPSERLTTRANKRNSRKRILPLEYIRDKSNTGFIRYILDYTDNSRLSIDSVLLTLGITLLKKSGLFRKERRTPQVHITRLKQSPKI